MFREKLLAILVKVGIQSIGDQVVFVDLADFD